MLMSIGNIMDNRIDEIIYQFEAIQEELDDLENTDRAYLLERIADLSRAVQEVVSKIEDIEIGE